MDNNYNNLKSFWNKVLDIKETSIINRKLIDSKSFDQLVDSYINDNDTLLDFGTGSGWAIMDISFKKKLKQAIGIDQSANAIDYDNRTIKASNINNLYFYQGDESILDSLNITFDTIISFNVIDVLPDNVIENILKALSNILKDNGHLIIGINPDYPLDLLTSLGYSIIDNYLYKDNILRGNQKSVENWIELFSKYFKFVELRYISINERELKYPRRVFVLTK